MNALQYMPTLAAALIALSDVLKGGGGVLWMTWVVGWCTLPKEKLVIFLSFESYLEELIGKVKTSSENCCEDNYGTI